MFIGHCHSNPGYFGLDKRFADAGTVERLTWILKEMKAEGAVVFAPFDNQYEKFKAEQEGLPEEANEWLREKLAEAEGAGVELVGFATVNPLGQDAVEQVERALEWGFKGVKIHPGVHKFRLDEPGMEAFWRCASECELTVSLHTGVHGHLLDDYRPLRLDGVLQRHRGMKLIIEHVGGYAFFHEALAVLENNPKAYAGLTQVSGRAPLFKLTRERQELLVESVGAKRLIMGLDYPWNPDNLEALKEDLKWLKEWPLNSEEYELVTGGNLKRLLGI